MSPIILAVNYRSRDTMEGRAGRQRILVLVYRSRDTIEGEIKALGRKRECVGWLHGRGAYAWKFMLIGSPLLFVASSKSCNMIHHGKQFKRRKCFRYLTC